LACHSGLALRRSMWTAASSGERAVLIPCLTEVRVLVILLTMTTLPLGEVKTHLSELVGRVHDHHERVTVTVHGRPSAVLVAIEDLERLEETLAILRDAETMSRLAESDAELARGESVSAAELAETMRRRSSGE
jgi:antitoxin YefM